jgi:hypothetical protein
MTHRTGNIINELPEGAKKVNCISKTLLDVDYWIHDGKIYKKTPNGKFRELVKQTKRPTYNHYFFRSKEDKKKLTLNVNKLDQLVFMEPKIKNDEVNWVKE